MLQALEKSELISSDGGSLFAKSWAESYVSSVGEAGEGPVMNGYRAQK